MVSTIDSLLMGMAAGRVAGPARPALAGFAALLENLLAGQGDAWLADLAASSSTPPRGSDDPASPGIHGKSGSLNDLAAVLLAFMNQAQSDPASSGVPVGDGGPGTAGLQALIRAAEPDSATLDAPLGEGELDPAGKGEPAGVSVTDVARFQAVLALLAAAMPTAAPLDLPVQSPPTAPSTTDEPATDLASTMSGRTGVQSEHIAQRHSLAPWETEPASLHEPARVAPAARETALHASEDVAVPAPARPSAPVALPATPATGADAPGDGHEPAGTTGPAAQDLPFPPRIITSGAASPPSTSDATREASDAPDHLVVAPSTGFEPEGPGPVTPRMATTDAEAVPPAGHTVARPTNAARSGPPPSAESAASTTGDPVGVQPGLTPQAPMSETPAPVVQVSDLPTGTERVGSVPEPAAVGSAPAGNGSEAAVDTMAERVTLRTANAAPSGERDDTPLRETSVEADNQADTGPRAVLSGPAEPRAPEVRPAPAGIATPQTPPQVARVLERVEHMVHAGQTSVRVRLEPEWLGPVEIRVVSRPGGLEVDLIARTPEARDLLERDLGWLQRGLVESGHDVQRVRVSASEPVPSGTAGALADQSGERGWQGHANAQAETDWRQSFRLYRLGMQERDADDRPRTIAGQRAAPARGIDVRV